jgi:hypothetical protein
MKHRGVLGGLLALVLLAAAHGTPAAWAVDGLPPGVPVPSWAKGQRVRFEPAEANGPRKAIGRPAASSGKVSPLTSSSRLQYHGGLVEYQPRLVLVFMGKQWEDDLALRHELEATAESLPGSAYQSILTQYSGLDGPISSPLAGSPIVETYYDSRPLTTRVDGAAVGQEGEEVIELTGARQDANATYAVLPAPGMAEPEEFICGFHEQYGGGAIFTPGPSIAAIMDTEARSGCITSKTLTHEYAESVTDPGSSGWNTGDGSEDEIADICNSLGPGRLADGALVAWLWDDSKGACEIEEDDPVPVPIGPYTETSRQTPSLEGSTNESVESEALETAIYPCDLEAHYYFEYGTTTAYGSRTPESVVPATWGAVKVNATIAGLQHSTPYHWRVVVETGDGTADGADHEFTIPYNVEIQELGATDVGLTEATLNGEVRPVGVEAKYHFEYGTTEAYGSSTPEASAGSGDSFVEASAVLSGLQLGTVYHYRLVASSSRGTTVGKDERFETYGGKPAIEASQALSIRYTEAGLNAKLDAKGVQTEFYFEYGTTVAYGQQTPEQSSEAVGLRKERATIDDLEPGTTYHFRMVATNGYGTSYGADESFSTYEEPLVETEAPSAVGYDTAALSGMVNPHGTNTSYYFEYGTGPAYGERTAEVAAGSGTSNIEAAQTAVNLAEDTTYHVRLVATTIYGITHGADRTFTTGVVPSVQTGAPMAVGSAGATLNGTINPHGSEMEYYFEYGPTPEYGLSTVQASAGSGNEDFEASQAISGLSPGATYHYRIVAVYGSVKQRGGDVTFTTAPLVEPIVTFPRPPLPPMVGPAPTPTPTVQKPSLSVSWHGNSLTVVLGLDRGVAGVAIDATVPYTQLSETKPRGHSRTIVLARLVRNKVAAGRLKLHLALDATGRRALRRRRVKLTVTATITAFGGERQQLSRTLVLG